MRIGKIKSKAELALHLLDACRLLRIERDKERDLILEKEQEKDTMFNLQVYFFVNHYFRLYEYYITPLYIPIIYISAFFIKHFFFSIIIMCFYYHLEFSSTS